MIVISLLDDFTKAAKAKGIIIPSSSKTKTATTSKTVAKSVKAAAATTDTSKYQDWIPVASSSKSAAKSVQELVKGSSVKVTIPYKEDFVSTFSTKKNPLADVGAKATAVAQKSSVEVVVPKFSAATSKAYAAVVAQQAKDLATVIIPTQSVPKASDWESGGDLAALESLTTSKPEVGTTGSSWSPTAILTKPWEKPVTTIVETEGYVSAKTYHDKVVAQLRGLDSATQDLITLIAGNAGIKAEDIEPFLFASGLDKETVTRQKILDNYSTVKQSARKFVESVGTELYVQSVTSASEESKDASAKLLESLNKSHPGGIANKENELLVNTYPELALTVALGVNSYENAINYLKERADIKGGGASSGRFFDFMKSITGFEEVEDLAYENCTVGQKMAKLASLMAAGIQYGINKELIARDINDLLLHNTPKEQQVELFNYVTNGGILNDAYLSRQGDPLASIWDAIKSETGSSIIGLVASGALIVGGGLVAGAGGAITGAGYSPFALQEIKNYTGYDSQRLKEILTASGMYPPTIDKDHDYAIAAVNDKINNLGYDQKNMTIDQIKAAKSKINESIDAELASVEKDAIALIAAGTYSSKKKALQDIKDTLAATEYKTTIVSSTTGISKEVEVGTALEQKGWVQGAEIKINAPEGYEYKLAGETESVARGYLIAHTSGKQVVEFYKDGKLIGSKEIGVYDSTENPTVALSQAEIAKWAQFDPNKTKTVATLKRTVYLPAGATMTVGGKTFTAGSKEMLVDITAVEGHTTPIQITQAGKFSKTIDVHFLGSAWDSIPILLEDDYTIKSTEKKAGNAIFTGLKAGSKVKIDGVEVDASRLVGYATTPGVDKSIVVSVKSPGYEERNVTVYLKAGESQEVSLAPTKEEFVKYESESSGGGGGGGYSGGGGSTASTSGKLVFGETCRDATIFLDNVESAPEIGVAYDLSSGYHAIVVKKLGYKDYSKTVYILGGQTTTFTPALEAGTSSLAGGTSGLGPLQGSNLGKLVFGESVRGAEITLDSAVVLPVIGTSYDVDVGYHSIIINKPGYLQFNKTIYIMSGQTLMFSPSLESEAGTTESTSGAFPNGYGGIRFGTVLIGSTITFDGNILVPDFGVSMQTAIGYHSIQVSKPGYITLTKTVYVAQDQILEFSPALESTSTVLSEPITGTGGLSYRVTFTSNPEGAKIMIGRYDVAVQDFTGQWTPGFVDLYPGLYKLRLYRSGYIDFITPLWVGEISYVGAAALAAAQASGVV